MKLSESWPLALVVALMVVVLLLNVPLWPDDGAVKVTASPETGLPKLSVTVTSSGLPKAVFTVVLCGEPEVATMLLAVPARLVRLKLAGVLTPLAAAVTV